MDFLLDQISILIPAFLAGIIVLSTHVPLGQEVIKRGIIFLDLAIAQIASFGVVLAQLLSNFLFHNDHEGIEDGNKLFVQVVAIVTAVLGATILYGLRNASAKVQECLIGVFFILAATGSILLLSKDPYASDHLRDILVGQILWVEYQQLIVVAIIYSAILFLWFFHRSKLGGFGFYPLFAIAITFSTQLVGIYLVFASLIIPALVSINFKQAYRYAYIVGLLGYGVGLILSAIVDLPSGAMIVWSLAIIGGMTFWFTRAINQH
ncbi:MAG: metal ABC transporter permease [Cellvibrionaceae bacterium]